MIRFDEILTHKGVRADTEEAACEMISAAFKRVFLSGSPTDEDRLLVLSELAKASRYFDVCEETDALSLATQNGNRAIFAHIVSLVFEGSEYDR